MAELKQQAEESAVNEDAIRDRLREFGVPKTYLRPIDFDLVPSALKSFYLRDIEKIAYGPGGMILAGPKGAGKSFAAVWLLRRLIDHQARLAANPALRALSPDRTAKFARMQLVIDAMRNKDLRRTRERLRMQRVLVIDDLGAEFNDSGGYIASLVDDLVDERWSEDRFTIATTNLDAQQLEERYPRVFSRLCDSRGVGLIVVDREDLRRQSG
ncbi:MAG: hypothetical protein AAF517_12840 [Planctomycetota bacterium]